MLPAEARHIIEALASGIDPISGEALPQHDLFNQPDVIRALFMAAHALEAAKPARSAPGNAGRSWSEEEETRLLQAFDEGRELKQIAAEHGRSRGAITSRLIRLGRLSEEDAQTV
ncbi:hypothetical protein [Chromobacterium sp. IIBBL 290-4]|uniref:hypothetical protein n=1 Tax=Chromobacterium sp. IIBBL 290-4 TaxID=2953890 RepID=UPI0020B8F653|nr:hypothetical protein [Chromobacterium sp. IIBBL 290-4]UTH72335.1 hypothetical protein NKT35_12295 [Chromobacterium sp. IIBBL 290-4]